MTSLNAVNTISISESYPLIWALAGSSRVCLFIQLSPCHLEASGGFLTTPCAPRTRSYYNSLPYGIASKFYYIIRIQIASAIRLIYHRSSKHLDSHSTGKQSGDGSWPKAFSAATSRSRCPTRTLKSASGASATCSRWNCSTRSSLARFSAIRMENCSI